MMYILFVCVCPYTFPHTCCHRDIFQALGFSSEGLPEIWILA